MGEAGFAVDTLGPGDPPRIGAYRLLARLGAGGMGQVYLARSDRGRTVAVKLVRAELAAQEEFRARFRQEVQAARRVGGHWTAPVLDADTEAAVPWVATGYVAGPSLQQVVGREHGALPERSVRILAAGLAHALKDIHAAGIVHRDLKPSNVLVTIDGPRVIDFGIARAMETVTDGGLTRTGALVGSPGFMAPEQVRGDRITPACDVFCLGSVLAYAATGTLPFGGADSGVHALMFRIAQEEPGLDGVPEGVADLVRDCLRKDPAARPTLDDVLRRTGAEDTVTGGRSRDPWLPGALVAQLGRHAVRLLDTEDPQAAGGTDAGRRTTPEHASAADEALPAAAGQRPGPRPQDRTPTAAAAQGAAPAAPPHPAYGAPGPGGGQGHPQQPAGRGPRTRRGAATAVRPGVRTGRRWRAPGRPEPLLRRAGRWRAPRRPRRVPRRSGRVRGWSGAVRRWSGAVRGRPVRRRPLRARQRLPRPRSARRRQPRQRPLRRSGPHPALRSAPPSPPPRSRPAGAGGPPPRSSPWRWSSRSPPEGRCTR
ncbi:hypothetical protein GCM10020295_39050 [Streptomyces cinereospinus]